jgi:protein O-GlcNAc transferase
MKGGSAAASLQPSSLPLAMTISEAFQMALQRHQAGRFAEAEALYRQILTVQPEHADALHLLGVAAHQTGRHDLAVGWIRQAIALNPKHSTAYSNLGEVCRALGRMDEAIDAYRRAIELKPDHTEAHNNLGVALKAAGRMDEAIAAYRRTLELRPDYPEAHNNLGNALAGQGKIEEAIAMYRRALELKPDYAEACNNLGTELAGQRKLGEAIAVYQRALKLRPDYPEAHNNLGVALKDLGELDEAMAACRRSLELKPDQSWTHSNLIYMLHFHPGHDDGTISEERDRWNRRFGGGFKRLVQTQANDPAVAGRRLRIGYVSPDFREHPVGRHMLPLFQNHDDRDFEILCYSGVTRSDRLTEELRQLAREWRSTVGVGDEALAEMIRRDGVDILVDLTQHMAENRLPVFARQPAPVQVSFAGYPDGTGLEAIEYRISDRYLEADRVDGEMGPREQVRLIDSFWCYDPCGMEVEVNPLPALESGLVTFGCLGNFCKVNDSVLRLWARALGKVSGFSFDHIEPSRQPPGADPGDTRKRGSGGATRGICGSSSAAGVSGIVSPPRHRFGHLSLQRPHDQPGRALDGRAGSQSGWQDLGISRGPEPADEPRTA